MKSLEDLKRLRDQAKKNLDMRQSKTGYRVSVGMATCGIASGARPILNRFLELVSEKELNDVMVTQVGCIGQCTFEPIAEVIDAKGNSAVYCKLTKEKVDEIVEKHLIGGEVVENYLLYNQR